ncbi:MAG: hypothetical protein GXX09_09630 [Syntrophomonadaceae bacterium]|nr:hypothetical protein [Syntrophomonadaceae bacterium]
MKDCPICRSPLQEIPKYGVLIDVCPECRGIWLDQGELQKILTLARDFEGEMERVIPRRQDYEKYHSDDRYYRQYDKHYRGEHHQGYRHGKKRHPLMEIFGDLFD